MLRHIWEPASGHRGTNMISVRNRCRLATANEDRPRLLAMRSSCSPPARRAHRETGPEARRAASWSASSQESLLGHAGHAASGDDQMVDGPDVHQVQGQHPARPHGSVLRLPEGWFWTGNLPRDPLGINLDRRYPAFARGAQWPALARGTRGLCDRTARAGVDGHTGPGRCPKLCSPRPCGASVRR